MKSFIANAIVAGLMLSGAAVADTINVPGDYPTIQCAINASSNGDLVVVASGSYNEKIDYMGKSITIQSEAGPELTSIDGKGLNGTLVRFDNGESEDSKLIGFTIKNGTAQFDAGGVTASNRTH